jgi:hypothetical protein
MMTRRKAILILTLILTLGFMLACNLGGDLAKANKVRDETNPIVAEANKGFMDADAKLGQLYTGKLDVAERQRQEPVAKDILNALDKSQSAYNTAAQKMGDAGQLKLEPWHKEYLDLKAQDYRKSSEVADVYKELIKLYLDYSITDPKVFVQKHDELAAKTQKLLAEARELEAKADKLEQDHKDQFKQ